MKHLTQDQLKQTLDDMDYTSRLLYQQAQEEGMLSKDMLAAHRQGYQLAIDALRSKFGMETNDKQTKVV